MHPPRNGKTICFGTINYHHPLIRPAMHFCWCLISNLGAWVEILWGLYLRFPHDTWTIHGPSVPLGQPKKHWASNQFLALALRSFSTSYPNSRPCLERSKAGCVPNKWMFRCSAKKNMAFFGKSHGRWLCLGAVYLKIYMYNYTYNVNIYIYILRHIHFAMHLSEIYNEIMSYFFIALDVERCPNWNQSTVSFWWCARKN